MTFLKFCRLDESWFWEKLPFKFFLLELNAYRIFKKAILFSITIYYMPFYPFCQDPLLEFTVFWLIYKINV